MAEKERGKEGGEVEVEGFEEEEGGEGGRGCVAIAGRQRGKAIR